MDANQKPCITHISVNETPVLLTQLHTAHRSRFQALPAAPVNVTVLHRSGPYPSRQVRVSDINTAPLFLLGSSKNQSHSDRGRQAGPGCQTLSREASIGYRQAGRAVRAYVRACSVVMVGEKMMQTSVGHTQDVCADSFAQAC